MRVLAMSRSRASQLFAISALDDQNMDPVFDAVSR